MSSLDTVASDSHADSHTDSQTCVTRVSVLSRRDGALLSVFELQDSGAVDFALRMSRLSLQEFFRETEAILAGGRSRAQEREWLALAATPASYLTPHIWSIQEHISSADHLDAGLALARRFRHLMGRVLFGRCRGARRRIRQPIPSDVAREIRRVRPLLLKAIHRARRQHGGDTSDARDAIRSAGETLTQKRVPKLTTTGTPARVATAILMATYNVRRVDLLTAIRPRR